MYAPLYEHAQLNSLTHETLHETFGIANMRAFEHLALLTKTGHLVTADGQEAYLPHLERLAIPITFIHGEQNACHGKQNACTSRRKTHEHEENDSHHQPTARRDCRTASMPPHIGRARFSAAARSVSGSEPAS